MIWVILGFLLGMTFAIKEPEKLWGGTIIHGIVIGLFLSLLSFMPQMIITIAWPKQLQPVGWYEIYSLERRDALNGAFVLGSGAFDETPRYYFYRACQGSTGKKLGWVNANHAIIFEDGENYVMGNHVVIYHKVLKHKPGKWLLLTNEYSVFSSAEIHVPKGTIVQEYRGQ